VRDWRVTAARFRIRASNPRCDAPWSHGEKNERGRGSRVGVELTQVSGGG
jgi:hypothetical protein